MSVSKFNPNSDVDGIELEYTHDRMFDRMRVHRSNTTGRLILNCYEKLSDGSGSLADLVFESEDALALAQWILEKFNDKSIKCACGWDSGPAGSAASARALFDLHHRSARSLHGHYTIGGFPK